LADYVERLTGYARKAAREAKLHTSWADANEVYETGLDEFIRRVLAAEAPFLRDALALCAMLAPVAAVHGLAQVALKLTAPGIPDIYQGCELWDFSLVDPDNRRSVDYERRRAILEAFTARGDDPALFDELLDGWRDGRIKLYLTWRLLQLRRDAAEAFAGPYRPLPCEDDGIVAYARGEIVVIAPRLVRRRLTGAGLRIACGDAAIGNLPAGQRYRNAVDGSVTSSDRGTVFAGEALARSPIAILIPGEQAV
jgi:(1->4)-alpha-D-glucan 1-alpha-D-glucosylmutase